MYQTELLVPIGVWMMIFTDGYPGILDLRWRKSCQASRACLGKSEMCPLLPFQQC